MGTQIHDADEESRYIVRVAIRSNADTPSEAAQDFAEHVMIHGFASVTFNVEDVIEGTDFIATLSDYGTADDVLAALDEDEGGWWVEPVDELDLRVYGPFEDEIEASARIHRDAYPLDPETHVVVYYPPGKAPERAEPAPTPEPEDQHVLVKGVCGRCGDLAEVVSGWKGTDAALNGKCLACVEDAQGVGA